MSRNDFANADTPELNLIPNIMYNHNDAKFPMERLLPNFSDLDSERVEDFINDFRQGIALTKWSNEQALYFVKNSLKGKARKALTTSLTLGQEKDFETFLTHLKNYFMRKKTVEELKYEFYSITHAPGMRIRELSDAIQLAAKKYLGGPEEENQVEPQVLDRVALNKLLSTIRADIGIELKKCMPKNFEEAVKKAEELAEILGDSCSVSNILEKNEQVNDSLTAQIQKLEGQINELNKQKSGKTRAQSDIKCLACGEADHILINCQMYREFIEAPQPQQTAGQDRRTVYQNERQPPNSEPRYRNEGQESRRYPYYRQSRPSNNRNSYRRGWSNRSQGNGGKRVYYNNHLN